MYKLIADDEFGQSNYILRTTDNTFIPKNPSKTSYQEYLEWLDEGNTPEPADEVTE